MIEELYARLGVKASASAEEIKAAYRALARQHHPDRNPGDEAAADAFRGIAEAYRVLGDPASRTRYDQERGFKPTPAGDQLRVDMFGPRGRGRRTAWSPKLKERGEDLLYRLEIELAEAALGGSRDLQLPSDAPCEHCRGTGAEPGSSPVLCGRCAGSGKIRQQQGFFDKSVSCPDCGGSGRLVPKPCRRCAGTGVQPRDRKLRVQIPPGVSTGTRLRMSGEGRQGENRGPAGDLIVELTVQPHPLLQLDGADLSMRLPVDIVTAALGGSMEVPTLEGIVRLEIPAGTQPGAKLRLSGRGARPAGAGPRGDLIVSVEPEIPTQLSTPARRLFEDLRVALASTSQDSTVARYRRTIQSIKGDA